MDRFQPKSSLRKSYSNEPKKTLSFVQEEHSELTSNWDKKSKSVHFADEESITEEGSFLDDSVHSHTSNDAISWLPSEHLYSEDTFIHDDDDRTGSVETTTKLNSHDQTTTIQTIPSYGSSTFVELESEDVDTDTDQVYSYSDSFISSEVISSTSQTDGTTYKEWKDVTEIVKDIEELEESDFVTRADSLELGEKDSDETDASETFDDEIAETARQDFISYALRHLRLKELQSPRSLAVDSVTTSASASVQYPQYHTGGGMRSKEERRFCRKMIRRCEKKLKNKEITPETEMSETAKMTHPLYDQLERHKAENRNKPLEYYGLNSALIQRLKLENLQNAMEKKSQDLDKDILRSEKFVADNAENDAIVKEKFISQMCAHVRRENMEDTIQAHLIKMHPVTKFAEFVSGLPPPDEDVQEILYTYRKQVENRMHHNDGTASHTSI